MLPPARARQAGRIALCTSLSASTGGIVAVCFDRIFGIVKAWDVSAMCSGILCGLVSITAGCAVVDTWAACIIGAIGGGIFSFASKTVLKLKIDDPLDAFAVHGACGAWGVIAAALFADDEFSKGGLFYGNGDMLGAAVVFVITVTAWSATLSALVSGPCVCVWVAMSLSRSYRALQCFYCLKRMRMLRTTVPDHVKVQRIDSYDPSLRPVGSSGSLSRMAAAANAVSNVSAQ